MKRELISLYWEVRKVLLRLWLEHWVYRKQDPEECCCGCRIGTGGSICYHGGCHSMKEYVISCRLEKIK